MTHFQSHTFAVLFLMLLIGCGQDRREEVTKRYPTGEKKKVRVYEGQGAEEELIERQTYARSGELIRVEKVAKGDTLYYGNLNSGLTDPKGLEKYLTEEAWISGNEATVHLQFTSDSMFVVEGTLNRIVDNASARRVEYLSGKEESDKFLLGGGSDAAVGKVLSYQGRDPDTIRIYPMGPDSFIVAATPYKRVNRNISQAVRKHRRQQQRPETASRNVTLEPRGNQMMYNRGGFTVPADETVELVFENTATSPSMQHNVIVLNEAPNEAIYKEVGQEAVRAGAVNDYVPDHPAVLAATPMSKPGETVSVTFRTPVEPGTYGFLCTYPGHWATMRGTMEVVPGVAR